MTMHRKTVLVTGASRGIGQALVDEALRRGAARVYAAARQPTTHPDERVTALTLDVTDAAQIQAAAGRVESVDLLINNAGVQPVDDLSDPAALEQALAVNLFGPYRVTQAFLPSLRRSRGTIVNNVSLAAIAPMPFAPGYSISKAAAFSLTQSLCKRVMRMRSCCGHRRPVICRTASSGVSSLAAIAFFFSSCWSKKSLPSRLTRHTR